MQPFIAIQAFPATDRDLKAEVSPMIVLAENEADAMAAFHAFTELGHDIQIVDEAPDPAWVTEMVANGGVPPEKWSSLK